MNNVNLVAVGITWVRAVVADAAVNALAWGTFIATACIEAGSMRGVDRDF